MVVVKNKLFVIGDTPYGCEKHDNASKLFTALKSKVLIEYLHDDARMMLLKQEAEFMFF